MMIQRLARACLPEPFNAFTELFREKRKSKGRRRIDQQMIFDETLRQAIEGEAGYLDDLTSTR